MQYAIREKRFILRIELTYDKLIKCTELWTWKKDNPEYVGKLTNSELKEVLDKRQYSKYTKNMGGTYNIKIEKLKTVLVVSEKVF